MVNTGNYLEEPPDDVDKTQEEWEGLSYDTQYYHANKDRQEYIREKNEERRVELRDKIGELKRERGCVVCDEDEPCALDFHHEGDKGDNIADVVNLDYSESRAMEEIEKCVVLCANCHRKHHHGVIEL